MQTKGKDWSQHYKMLCDIFLKSEYVTHFGATKLGLARCLGASQGKTQNWEKGQWPSASDLAVIAEKFGCSYRWLVTGEGDPFDHQQPPTMSAAPPRLRAVPMMGLASCGVEGWNQQTSIAVSASPLIMGEKMVAVVAAGESMVPAGIASGQICYCDPEQPVLEGDAVYVVRRDNMATIKMYLGEGERAGYLRMQGWLDPDAQGVRRNFFIDVLRDQVVTIAPVIYVRRRL
ncbi:LexA family transcriptional regulator [Nitratidesulfovibrio vulgaris]|uniref:LexA family transcriptional regulator n=1 Tax=Nitratidesulfovibrio vulgaris TaxID=881 RepID=UPI0013E8DEF9|nr:helix-turn-helix transcriptional regulator [Nitratidesulfovibrio vulgaris]